MAAVAPPPTATTAAGGSFLINAPETIFTPEDFTEEHRQIASTATRFMDEEVLPVVGDYEQKKDGLARSLVEKAGELGLLSILAPEKFGGLEMDVTSQMLVADTIGRYAAFSVTYGAQCGIGMLPLVFFGNDEQKERWEGSHWITKFSGHGYPERCVDATALSDPGPGATWRSR